MQKFVRWRRGNGVLSPEVKVHHPKQFFHRLEDLIIPEGRPEGDPNCVQILFNTACGSTCEGVGKFGDGETR
eukprot:11999920-Ditylum_brightwellii.AAC.1